MDLHYIPLADFKNRIFQTQERVHFSAVDAYGHLNAAKYFEMVLNHRVHAVEEQVEVITMDILNVSNIALVLFHADLKFSKPSFMSDTLIIQSYISEIGEKFIVIEAQILDSVKKEKRFKAALKFISVDLKTHSACKMPESLPTRGNPKKIFELPLSV